MYPDIYTVYADGGKKKGVAYGSFRIFDTNGNEVAHKQLIFGPGTSNLAEYLAITAAMRYCLDHDLLSICILSDSNLAVHHIQGLWATNFEHLALALYEVQLLQIKFDYFSIKYVPRNITVAMLGH